MKEKKISEKVVNQQLLDKIPYSFAKKHSILVSHKNKNGSIVVFTDNPNNIDGFEEIRWIFDSKIEIKKISTQLLKDRLSEAYQTQERASAIIASLENEDGQIQKEQGDLLDQNEKNPIVALLNEILKEAIQQRASDIHFEPLEDMLQIRYRIDGVLHQRHKPATVYQSKLITRIKVLAKMDIAQRRLPQDGRLKLIFDGREIDFRVSTIPVIHGERIVMRILDKKNIVMGLDQIGIPESILDQFKKIISTPEGIILVTGPTGSGKTTTLYSSISQICNNEINIMTIEDPVEYKLEGIAQINVQPKIGFSFANGLRQILRQDPDVVMVGEIRDAETAIIAVQASLTGHLVMSTLHTNDAPSAIIRLRDMGIEPYLLSSSIIGVVSQRLVRKLCEACKEPYRSSIEEAKFLNQESPIEIFKPKGCDLCYNLGYKGRVGIYEFMQVNQEIRKHMNKDCDSTTLQNVAKENGMKSLKSHAIESVKNGQTTISEILQIIKAI